MSEKPPVEIIEFQPDALEIQHSRLPRIIRLCVWLPFVVMVLLILWASLAEVDVVVQGNGKIVTNLPTIVMKPLERSVIKSIDVKIGDVVKKGQVLITFDPAFNTAESERLKNERAALSAQLSRLRAEFTRQPYRGESDQFSRWQQAIYSQRQEYYKQRIKYFDEALLQINASKTSTRDSLKKQEERLAEMRKLEEMYINLSKTGAAAVKDKIEVSISRMEMEATVDQLRNTLLELDHRLGTTLAEKNSFIQEWRNSIAEDMVTVDRNLTATLKEYDKVQRLIEYVYLRAPCDAVVHEIASFSPGSAVQEAEALITLVPIDENMELEVEIRPQDIAKLNIGAKTRVKLNAYPFQKHGTLNGEVRNISENTLQKGKNGEEMPYYRARVTINGKLQMVKDDFRLIPGMDGICEIKCGRRKVIEYVIYPLIKAFDETAKEP